LGYEIHHFIALAITGYIADEDITTYY